MNCKNAQALLSAHLDLELSGADSTRLKIHLAACPSCMAEYEDLRSIKHMLSSVPVVEPDAAFEQRLFATVFGQPATQKAGWLNSWQLIAGVGVAAASLTLLVLNHFEDRSGLTQGQDVRASIARDIRQDQAAWVGNDPYGGAPLVVPTAYASK